MNINLAKSDELNGVLAITLQKDDYLPKVEQTLRDYRKKLALKGFRPGQAPTTLVKKMYGNAILFEEINKATSQAIQNYIEEEKLDILGQPLPLPNNNNVSIDINNPAEVNFEFELGFAPKIELGNLTNIKIEQQRIQVTESDIDKEVDNVALRYGNAETPEDATVQDKDILTFELIELDGDAPKEGGINNTAVVNEDMIIDKKVRKALPKYKVGSMFTANIFTLLDREKEQIIHQILGVKDDGNHNHDGIGENYQITITKITRMQKAAINQELFDKIYGEGVCNSEDEFRNKLKEEIENYTTQLSQNKLKEAIYKELIENTSIAFPATFLKKFIKHTNEKPISDEQLEQEYPNFEKGLKWNLITNHIAKENDIKIEFDQVREFSKQQIQKQLSMYNPTGAGIDDNTLSMLNDNMLKKEEHVRKSYDACLEQKLFDFLKDQVSITEKELTFESFLNQTKQ